jgi:hypothetical protein
MRFRYRRLLLSPREIPCRMANGRRRMLAADDDLIRKDV